MTKQSPQDPGSNCTGAINININIPLWYHRVKDDQYNRIIKSEMNNCLHVVGERNINYNRYGRAFRARWCAWTASWLTGCLWGLKADSGSSCCLLPSQENFKQKSVGTAYNWDIWTHDLSVSKILVTALINWQVKAEYVAQL